MANFIDADGSVGERTSKSLTLVILAALAFMVLVLRLVFIQIIDGQKNLGLADSNRMRRVRVSAPRGQIYDRYGRILAGNRPSFKVMIRPNHTPKGYPLDSLLLLIVDSKGEPLFDSLELYKALSKAKRAPSRLHELKEDVSIEFVSIISEHSRELPGITIETEGRREYPYGEAAFHAVGYLAKIPAKNIDSLVALGYDKNARIGMYGLEKYYEPELHGIDGFQYEGVNAYGRSLGVVEDMPIIKPVPGSSIHLNIDAELQKVAYNAFDDTARGALIALDPRNGEILGLVSSPTIDPNLFAVSAAKRAIAWRKAQRNPLKPFNNRAVGGSYPPASTFKLISGLAMVDHGDKGAQEFMPQPCHGSFKIGRRTARCWNAHGHGKLNLYDAIKTSCNVYFYQLGLLVGDSVLLDYSKRLGLGSKTGIDLTYERTGWLSGRDLYNKKFKKLGWRWTQGLVLDMAIGQAQVVTPLQMAVAIGAIGNGVDRYQPSLMNHIENVQGDTLWTYERKATPLNVHQESIEEIKIGMERVVDSAGGTGRRVRVKGIPVGGKSGSAENPHGDKTHAWFVAVAPLDNPTIAVACLVENAGHGGSVAGPIVGKVLNYYFNESPEGRKVAEQYRGRTDELK